MEAIDDVAGMNNELNAIACNEYESSMFLMSGVVGSMNW